LFEKKWWRFFPPLEVNKGVFPWILLGVESGAEEKQA
jgi:hypothetical protein